LLAQEITEEDLCNFNLFFLEIKESAKVVIPVGVFKEMI
jgi:hypothetical protein